MCRYAAPSIAFIQHTDFSYLSSQACFMATICHAWSECGVWCISRVVVGRCIGVPQPKIDYNARTHPRRRYTLAPGRPLESVGTGAHRNPLPHPFPRRRPCLRPRRGASCQVTGLASKPTNMKTKCGENREWPLYPSYSFNEYFCSRANVSGNWISFVNSSKVAMRSS